MYNYEAQKQNIFTEEGQEMFVKMRDKAKELLSIAGCFRMQEIMSAVEGDTWDMLACVDRMIEVGDIKEVTNSEVAGQYRIFTGVR